MCRMALYPIIEDSLLKDLEKRTHYLISVIRDHSQAFVVFRQLDQMIFKKSLINLELI